MSRRSELRLLGDGLDAIVYPVARPRHWWERLFRLRPITDPDTLRPLSDSARMARYHDAALLHPISRSQQVLDRREVLGWHYLKAWREGWFPKITARRRLISVPTSKPARQTGTSAARGAGRL